MTILSEIAHSVLLHIRRTETPPWFTDDESRLIFQLPLIDAIRHIVEPSDIEKLQQIVSEDVLYPGNLALGAMKLVPFPHAEQYYTGLWRQADQLDADAKFDRRTTILPALLGLDIPDSIRDEGFAYLTDPGVLRGQVLAKLPPWFSRSPERLIPLLEARLSSPEEAPKRWLYLLISLASRDSSAVHSLFQKHCDSSCRYCLQVKQIARWGFNFPL